MSELQKTLWPYHKKKNTYCGPFHCKYGLFSIAAQSTAVVSLSKSLSRFLSVYVSYHLTRRTFSWVLWEQMHPLEALGTYRYGYGLCCFTQIRTFERYASWGKAFFKRFWYSKLENYPNLMENYFPNFYVFTMKPSQIFIHMQKLWTWTHPPPTSSKLWAFWVESPPPPIQIKDVVHEWFLQIIFMIDHLFNTLLMPFLGAITQIGQLKLNYDNLSLARPTLHFFNLIVK